MTKTPTSSLSDRLARARDAALVLGTATRAAKDAALRSMAGALMSQADAVLAANAADVARGRDAGLSEALLDRLALSPARLAGMADGLRELAGMPDPVGEIVDGWTLPGGVRVERIRVPFGVIGVIYEARPNVTADTAGICLKAGNAVVLRGSASAVESNRAVAGALRSGLDAAGLPPDCVNLLEGGHEVTDELMRARGQVDLLVPRGGAGLIQAVVTGSQVPVIETGVGNCHLFVDDSADPAMAGRIIVNAKTQRPSVCNALETLLVHEAVAGDFVPQIVSTLAGLGVRVHGDAAAQRLDGRIDAVEGGWDDESLSLDLRVAIVPDVDGAIEFIRAHGSGHSETIVTNDLARQRRFVAQVDAAAVLVNASSRFVDGGQFGFGAEIGISTQKLHARGPMGPREMTTTKYVLTGEGQVRA